MRLNKSNMTVCPFHPDKTPSLKVDKRFYCFGCGAKGDSIDLAGNILGLSPFDTVMKLAADFGIKTPFEITSKNVIKFPSNEKVDLNQWLSNTLRILFAYRDELDKWRDVYRPNNVDEKWHPRFCESMALKNRIEYLIEKLLFGDKSDQEKIYKEFNKEVERIGKRYKQI